jgi:hypothetical protein
MIASRGMGRGGNGALVAWGLGRGGATVVPPIFPPVVGGGSSAWVPSMRLPRGRNRDDLDLVELLPILMGVIDGRH